MNRDFEPAHALKSDQTELFSQEYVDETHARTETHVTQLSSMMRQIKN